ncbi:hypothetical protein BJX68DRAFT_74168 [Aspergillus pseudodeflectus]|uniref:Uncharacterized protein n=1 Tax=Aspergillus pseudodeflectus TaxID=176178 RepID=A0ABR4KFS7_9EURO
MYGLLSIHYYFYFILTFRWCAPPLCTVLIQAERPDCIHPPIPSICCRYRPSPHLAAPLFDLVAGLILIIITVTMKLSGGQLPIHSIRLLFTVTRETSGTFISLVRPFDNFLRARSTLSAIRY